MTAALVIDDHPAIHVGCQQMLGTFFPRVHAAHNRPEALALAQSERPVFILLDLALRDSWGLDLMEPLRSASPSARIVIFTMNDKPVLAARALQVGARGFLGKDALPGEFRRAIETVLSDEIYLSDAMARRLALLHAAPETDPVMSLTDRERRLLCVFGRGGDLSAAAEELQVSYKTAANLSSLIKRKLGVHTLADLIRIGLRLD